MVRERDCVRFKQYLDAFAAVLIVLCVYSIIRRVYDCDDDWFQNFQLKHQRYTTTAAANSNIRLNISVL